MQIAVGKTFVFSLSAPSGQAESKQTACMFICSSFICIVAVPDYRIFCDHALITVEMAYKKWIFTGSPCTLAAFSFIYGTHTHLTVWNVNSVYHTNVVNRSTCKKSLKAIKINSVELGLMYSRVFY